MKRTHITNLILGILGFLFITSCSVVLVLNFRPLYYHDMRAQHLAELYQTDEEEIKENYDVLIDYNSLFYRKELNFPTLPMSREGRIHFEEVKRIFDAIQVLLFVTALSFLPLAFYQIRKRQYRFLLLIPVITGITGGMVLLLALVNWNDFFETFHHLLFRNDYWLFDPDTDPIINFLPDSFFFHCLFGIILLMVCFLMLSLVLHHILSKHRKAPAKRRP